MKLLLSALFFVTAPAHAQIVFKLPSTPEYLFEKMLGREKSTAGKKEYEVVNTGLVRCNRLKSDSGSTESTSCFNYFDNGQHPIFTKGTAVDLYEVGMAKIPEYQVTDNWFEKSSKLSCMRFGDEGVYSYQCKVSPIAKGDESIYRPDFRDGIYSADGFSLEILGNKASIESVWVSGDGRTRVCGMEFKLFYNGKFSLSAIEDNDDLTESEYACSLEINADLSAGGFNVTYAGQASSEACKARCNTEAEVVRNGLKYQR